MATKIEFDERQLISQMEMILPSILDSIAKSGLTALKRVLDNSGFADSPYLKNYEISSEISKEYVTFNIELDERAISDETKRKMRKETENVYKNKSKEIKNRPEARDFRRIYMMGPDGRPERIHGQRDARKPIKNKKFQKDARTIASDRDHLQIPKNSGDRYVEHEFKATNPRSMEVNQDGKVRITMQREIRNTNRKVIFPQGEYQGVIKKFLDELTEMVGTEFGKELDQIMRNI